LKDIGVTAAAVGSIPKLNEALREVSGSKFQKDRITVSPAVNLDRNAVDVASFTGRQ
jgi:hypothetical protein